MHSSPELDDNDEMFPDEADGPSTPTNAIAGFAIPSSDLSPPDSQGPAHLGGGSRDDPFVFAGSPSTLNANGKRMYPVAATGMSTSAGMPTSVQAQTGQYVHKPTGYTWDKPEDEPGYSWLNKKAVEEYSRAMDQIVDKGSMIGNKYGDPMENRASKKK
ncbi:hypothetical protein K432DRAFT_377197 [Lepidopterella palustris CBS 459.81]|uniref:Uncharacterized protein n=1 Tax=Lepidopterella palustris CBS 459.81 TaxID=1314670 RepID=A0A8E2EKW0_9PEZI|nr:hypothetical protein K432DRAFT_377197 [Lepidopterella palustris CBS 459.81]